MAEYNLGRVAFYDKGAYSNTESYEKWDFVTTDDSTYLYINDLPSIGKAVTNTDYWKCIADGKPSTLAAASVDAKLLEIGEFEEVTTLEINNLF